MIWVMSVHFDTAYQSPPPASQHAALGKHMHDAHLADCLDLAMQGIVCPWDDSDIILQEDEERLLNAILDAGGLHMRHTQTASTDTGLFQDLPTYTRTSTAALGMTANANAQAVVNRALQAGWITQTYSEADGCYVLDCTARGMIMLERQAQQKEWGDD